MNDEDELKPSLTPQPDPQLDPQPDPNPEPVEPVAATLPPRGALHRITAGQWAIIALIVAETVFALLYGGLRHEGLLHSGALFVGLPAVLALLLALAPRAVSVTGGILRGITLALLIIAPLLGEGYICILIASPLFYAVGLVIGLVADHNRRQRRATLGCLAVVLLPMCLEGVVPELTPVRTQRVSVSRIVRGTPAQVMATLAQPPDIRTPVPHFWNIGFPRPIAASGSGLAPGDLRIIRFSAAEEAPAGDLTLRVREAALHSSGAGHAEFLALADSSKIDHWMRWRSSTVDWAPTDPAHTEVRWTITFDRGLDPWWYFGLWEDAAVHEAAQYLITANATPRPVPGP